MLHLGLRTPVSKTEAAAPSQNRIRFEPRPELASEVWPMVVFRHWSLRALAALSYVAVAGGFNLLPRPSLVFALFRMCGLPLVALLYLTLGDEWGSVWCWTA